jgi:hypothetical protein
MIKLILVMLTAACSLIWLVCTYQKQEWGLQCAFIAASCALIIGLDWFSVGITIPSNLVEIEEWINMAFITIGTLTVYHLHRMNKINW